MDYMFEKVQNLRVEVYDRGQTQDLTDLEKHYHVGAFDFRLGQVIGRYKQMHGGFLIKN